MSDERLELTPEICQRWIEILPQLKEQIRQSDFPIKIRVSFGAILEILDVAITDRVKTCEWTPDETEYGTTWKTCADDFVFIDDGPIENNMKFCPHCGRRLTTACTGLSGQPAPEADKSESPANQ